MPRPYRDCLDGNNPLCVIRALLDSFPTENLRRTDEPIEPCTPAVMKRFNGELAEAALLHRDGEALIA
jgi:hypothetical protein